MPRMRGLPGMRQGEHHRPYSLRPRGGRRLSRLGGAAFPPRQNAEGTERRAAHRSFVLPRSCCQERGRLPALRRGVFTAAPGRAFGSSSWRAARLFRRRSLLGDRALKPTWPAEPTTVSELLAGGHSAPGRCPDAARVRGSRYPRPRAPHQPAVSRRPSEAKAPHLRRRLLIVAPSSRRLATTPSAEPGKAEDERSMWRNYGFYSYIIRLSKFSKEDQCGAFRR